MSKQVFLGGAAGTTTWRKDIAIPALEAAGVSYYDPQLGLGEWTEACEAAEMQAKEEAEVLLFVVNGETRGVATIGEVAYSLGLGRALALVVTDVPEGACLPGPRVSPAERDDLNRGRIFLRSMAREHGVPVFTDVAAAVQHAIRLINTDRTPCTLEGIREVLQDAQWGEYEYSVEPVTNGFLLFLTGSEVDTDTGHPQRYEGRRWYLSTEATRADVVKTAFLAARTWQEHEVRDTFTYRNRPIFSGHADIDQLSRLFHARRTPDT